MLSFQQQLETLHKSAVNIIADIKTIFDDNDTKTVFDKNNNLTTTIPAHIKIVMKIYNLFSQHFMH